MNYYNFVDMDQLWYSGKFWVTIIVVLIVLLGLFTFLIGIDRRVHKLENSKPNQA